MHKESTADKMEIRLQSLGLPQDYRGGLLAKFYLTDTKLYSYTFTLPDPD